MTLSPPTWATGSWAVNAWANGSWATTYVPPVTPPSAGLCLVIPSGRNDVARTNG